MRSSRENHAHVSGIQPLARAPFASSRTIELKVDTHTVAHISPRRPFPCDVLDPLLYVIFKGGGSPEQLSH